MKPSNPARFAVIGAGNVGLSLAHLLSAHGFTVNLGSRRATKETPRNSIKVDKRPSVQYSEAVENADFILLTVPDDVLEATCSELSEFFPVGAAVAHCSGALDSDVLLSAKSNGCAIASLHPLNTFPSPQAGIKTLSDPTHSTALYYEGDERACHSLIPIFESLGFNPHPIDKESKGLYHAACVISCNLLTALMDVSLNTAEAANIDRNEFWRSIKPLITNTLSNIGERGTATALSGPIARGDIQTVAKQTALLSTLPKEIGNTYKDLSKHARPLASLNA